MKRFVCTLLMMASMAITGCSFNLNQDKANAKDSEKLLVNAGFQVEILSEAETKARVQGLDFGSLKVENGLYATKKENDKITDFLLAFYFTKGADADAFTNLNNGENLGLLDKYAESILGAENKMVGLHNNVVYAGSSTSYVVAGLTIE